MGDLFRKKAQDYSIDRLQGDLLLLPYFSHVVITGFLVLWVALLLIWLFSSDYARKETVVGWVEPQSGVTRIYPNNSGVIERVLISEGDSVTEGQPLIIINGDRFLVDGGALEEELLEEFKAQKNRLLVQIERTKRLHDQRGNDLSAQVDNARSDLTLIARQLDALEQQKEIISDRHNRYKELLEKDHISIDEYHNVLSQLLDVENEVQGLVRAEVGQKNQIQRLHAQLDLIPIEKEDQIDQLNSALSDIVRQMARLHGERAYVIKAPREGVVTNLQAKVGQQAGVVAGTSLMVLVPEDSELIVELLVPVRAAGFVQEGQAINIRYDAFPHQKFGFYSGEVFDVSTSVMLPSELPYVPANFQEPVYVAKARLKSPYVNAFGKKVGLRSGMTLNADIKLSERSLVRWVLEPLYTLKGNI